MSVGLGDVYFIDETVIFTLYVGTLCDARVSVSISNYGNLEGFTELAV